MFLLKDIPRAIVNIKHFKKGMLNKSIWQKQMIYLYSLNAVVCAISCTSHSYVMCMSANSSQERFLWFIFQYPKIEVKDTK